MKIFSRLICLSFILWIALFPQPVHDHFAFYSNILLIVLFLALLIYKRGAGFLFCRDDIFLWLFLGWQIFSVLFAHDKQIAWQRYADFVIPFIVLYFIFKEGLDLNKASVRRYILSKEDSRNLSGYKRYQLTASGISPLAVPSWINDVIYADSDEHNEEGHITEDAGTRVKMVEKRFYKKMGRRVQDRCGY